MAWHRHFLEIFPFLSQDWNINSSYRLAFIYFKISYENLTVHQNNISQLMMFFIVVAHLLHNFQICMWMIKQRCHLLQHTLMSLLFGLASLTSLFYNLFLKWSNCCKLINVSVGSLTSSLKDLVLRNGLIGTTSKDFKTNSRRAIILSQKLLWLAKFLRQLFNLSSTINDRISTRHIAQFPLDSPNSRWQRKEKLKVQEKHKFYADTHFTLQFTFDS